MGNCTSDTYSAALAAMRKKIRLVVFIWARVSPSSGVGIAKLSVQHERQRSTEGLRGQQAAQQEGENRSVNRKFFTMHTHPSLNTEIIVVTAHIVVVAHIGVIAPLAVKKGSK